MLVCLRWGFTKALTPRLPPCSHPISLHEPAVSIGLQTHANIQNSPFDRFTSPRPASYSTLQDGDTREHELANATIAARMPPFALRKDPRAWLSLLEPFLPSDLRQGSEEPKDAKLSKKERTHPEKTIVSLLQQARATGGCDVLADLGIRDNRWTAVHWLANTLLDTVATMARNDASSLKLSVLASVPGSLDDLTHDNSLEDHRPSTTSIASLDDLTEGIAGEAAYSFQMGATRLRDDTMGQIWKSLGFMVIKAMEMKAEAAKSVMSHVFRILAHVHHMNLIPAGVYSYNPAMDPSAPFRPPIIHLLSSRILTTMSDAVWKAHEEERARGSGVKYENLIHSIPGSRHKLKVRGLGREVWVEFILWCCVDGGFLEEGAWILKQARKSAWDEWKVVDWPTVEKSSLNPESNSPRVNLKRLFDRSDMVVSETEGYSFDRPFVEMGHRTISAEVIFALIDGLVSTVRTGAGLRGGSLGSVLADLMLMKYMLETKGVQTKPGFWDRIVIRLIESFGVDPRTDPSSLDKILSLVPVSDELQVSGASHQDPDEGPSEDALANSAARLGLFHYLLDVYCQQGDVHKTIATFEKCHFGLLNFILALKRDAFLERHRTDPQGPTHYGFKPRTEPSDVKIDVPVTLPVPLVPSFLDLVCSANILEFGRWLLYSDEADKKPFIPTTYYGIPSLAPSLLRFAAKSDDGHLFRAVSNKLARPMPKDALRALLRGEIARNNWPAVQRMLQFLKTDAYVGWGIGDAMALAAKILHLEQAVNDREFKSPELENPAVSNDAFSNPELSILEVSSLESSSPGTPGNASSHLLEASKLLVSLLEGDFDAPSNGLRTKLRLEDLINQLARIFTSIPGNLHNIATRTHPDSHSTDTLPSNHLPADAFNLLLAAVVDTRGPLEGKKLWDRWCHDPQYLAAEKIQQGGIPLLHTSREMPAMLYRPISGERAKEKRDLRDADKLIVAHLRTFRTLVRSAVAERRKGTGNEELEEMMDWIVEMFSLWGVATDKALDKELDGYLSERKEVRKLPKPMSIKGD